jgi:putative DNA primase/helicase
MLQNAIDHYENRIAKYEAQISALVGIAETERVTGKNLSHVKKALITESNRTEAPNLKSESCDVHRFYAEFKDRFVWDLVPTDFLYDLYIAYCKQRNPKISSIGRTAFRAKIMQAINDDPSSFWVMSQNALRTADKMEQREPLVDEYNLTDWQGVELPLRTRGIVRKQSC